MRQGKCVKIVLVVEVRCIRIEDHVIAASSQVEYDMDMLQHFLVRMMQTGGSRQVHATSRQEWWVMKKSPGCSPPS